MPKLPYLSLFLLMATLFAGCSRTIPSVITQAPRVTPQPLRVSDEARQQMELIPPPSKSRYMAIKSLDSWENPYVTVQGAMVTLHVLLADANTSALGEGGMLRPLGARRQDLNVRVSDLPAALNAIPESAWPYGRVVAVEEAHNIPVHDRPQVRRNVETTMQMLNDLGVVVYEWSDAGAGLR